MNFGAKALSGKAPSGICADRGQSYQSIESSAASIRLLIAPDVPVHEALPGLQLFEWLDHYIVNTASGPVQLEPAVEPLPPGVEGWTRYDKPRNRIVVALSSDTYEELERDNHRARFSFGHEVGHGVLHPNELMRTGTLTRQMAALRRGEALLHKKFMDTEWQANAFAAALLIPAAGLVSLEKLIFPIPLDAFFISNHFKVSSETAAYRLESFQTRRMQLLAQSMSRNLPSNTGGATRQAATNRSLAA